MPRENALARQDTSDGYGFSLAGWAVLMVLLVIGGLLLAARAGDDYMFVSGFLFSAFGVFFGFRLLDRMLP